MAGFEAAHGEVACRWGACHGRGMVTFDAETLKAVGDLLALGEQHGFGISFSPVREGWCVGYLRGSTSGDLVTGSDLGDMARAAMRPLADLTRRDVAGQVERVVDEVEYDDDGG